jgi:hypothetical protein
MSDILFFIEEGYYSIKDLEDKILEFKNAEVVMDKRYEKHLKEAMGEVKDYLKKEKK